MDMTQTKPEPESLVDGDLEKMTRDELITAILTWRKLAPQISEICNELADYRQLAPSPGELKLHIDNTIKIYRETIAKQASQIEQMNSFIQELSEDPYQIEKRLEQLGGGGKRRLN